MSSALAMVCSLTASAQTVGLSVGYASPSNALSGKWFSGYVVAGDVGRRNPDRLVNWRVRGSFTELSAPVNSMGARLPSSQLYGLAGGVVIAPRGTGWLPYASVGPGFYGFRSLTEYHLGWHAGAGLEKGVGPFKVFGEGSLTSFNSMIGVSVGNARVRSFSIGLRR
jgi:hypothetical protein